MSKYTLKHIIWHEKLWKSTAFFWKDWYNILYAATKLGVLSRFMLSIFLLTYQYFIKTIHNFASIIFIVISSLFGNDCSIWNDHESLYFLYYSRLDEICPEGVFLFLTSPLDCPLNYHDFLHFLFVDPLMIPHLATIGGQALRFWFSPDGKSNTGLNHDRLKCIADCASVNANNSDCFLFN